MKIETNNRLIRRSGNMQEQEFGIVADAKMFDILSSKLYTDIPLAIVRELSTNAYDAQVDAGNGDRQFNVHLPNRFHPYFSIRDFGTGMSPDTVQQVYTQYGNSTRSDSNAFVGALGLGSKSPFAYTDQFTVTSYHDGIAYSYSAFKNEKGNPSIALMSQEETTEENGVEIRINVQQHHLYDFEAAAQRVYFHFPVLPKVTGTDFSIVRPEPIIEGKGYKLYDNGRSQGRLTVVMGNVGYRLSSSKFTNTLGYSAHLVIEAEIGSCDIQASREDLNYTDRTNNYLARRVEEAVRDATAQAKNLINQNQPRLKQIMNARKCGDLLTLGQSFQKIDTEVPNGYKLRRVSISGNKLHMGQDRFSTGLQPHVSTQYHFIHNDVGEIRQSDRNRIRHYLQSNQLASHSCFLVDIEDPKVYDREIGQIDVNLSDLPDAPRKSGGGGGGGNGGRGSFTFIKKLVGRGDCRRDDAWQSTTDIASGKVMAFVRLKDHKVMINGEVHPPKAAYNIAQEMGYTAYGISEKHFDRLCKELDLERADNVIKSYVKNQIDRMTKWDQAFHYTYYKETPWGISWHKLNISNNLLKWVDGASTACNNVVKLSKASRLSQATISMARLFNLDILPKDTTFEDYEETFKKRYPLLAQVDTSRVKSEDVREYILLIESK
jgi:hypothetical protein